MAAETEEDIATLEALPLGRRERAHGLVSKGIAVKMGIWTWQRISFWFPFEGEKGNYPPKRHPDG